MMRKKTIVFAGIFVCLALLAFGYYMYNKPRTGAAAEDTDAAVTARQLYQAFVKDEQTAGLLYVNKVLEVSGVVAQVQQTGQDLSVLLSGDDNGGGVNCSITAAGQEGSIPPVGTPVHIKGRCTGFLMDVSLVDAAIINKQ